MLRDDLALLHGQKRVLEMIATGAPLPGILTELIALIEVQEPGMGCGILVPITPLYLGACREAVHWSAPIIVLDVARKPC